MKKITAILVAPKLFTVENICLGLIKHWEIVFKEKIKLIAEKDGYMKNYNGIIISKNLKYSNKLLDINDLKYLFSIRKEFENSENKNIIVFAVTLKIIFLVRVARIFKKNIFVVNCHRGLGRHFNIKEKNKLLFLKRFILIKILTFCCNRSCINWLTNESDVDFLMNKKVIKKNQKIILTKNSIDIDKYGSFPKSKNNQFEVVMVSRLIKAKGIEIVLDCLEIISKSNENIKVTLAGSFENEEDTKTKVYNACKKYKFLNYCGFVKDTREIYRNAKIAILPSRYNEGGYPRSILEPMANGIPVITSNIKGCNNGINNFENGILINPYSAEELFQSIITLKNNKSIYERISNEARRYIQENHSHTKIAQKVISELSEFINQK